MEDYFSLNNLLNIFLLNKIGIYCYNLLLIPV